MKTETLAEKNAEVKQPYPQGRWAVPQNPFKPAGVSSPASPQGELSLDQVRPVRNDLSDADLELLALKKPAPENVFAAPAVAEARPSRWARWKARWFGRKSK